MASGSGQQRRALVVRGGWDGHVPVEATDSFVPFLRHNGFTVRTDDSLDAYLDADALASTDLIVQCWTMGEISEDQLAGLSAAVRAGTGFAGWHGGIVDAFRGSVGYLWLTGGQFLAHPGNHVDYEVRVVPERAGHEIVRGIEGFAVHSEQYWVAADGANDVLATTTFGPRETGPAADEVTVPVVWTRQWGSGRVFVNTVGHDMRDFAVAAVRTLTERGLLWASR